MQRAIKHLWVLLFVAAVVVVFVASVGAFQASAIPTARLLNPEDLLKVLQNTASERPLMIQVGSHVLYAQAHIPGSEYLGAGNTPEGMQHLRQRVHSLPKSADIVLYCGCCPWSHCPNVNPAYEALQQMGFTNVKVLYIANNFGADWVDKGYPVAKGE
jgi:rhodanese-related sulfurtransferase